ncbi:hypothetical protein GCM10023189_10700 [Nibrella saemangeumensis]|uniref:Por secretion system C-terminal sorting domain-containing protein n=2 Tax=Nibrella saemangeumensis TaxID=1084526 RepID=A0ABP8MIT1_9BACT
MLVNSWAILALLLLGLPFMLLSPSALAQDVNNGKENASPTAGAILLDQESGLPLRPAGLYSNTFSSKDGSCLYLVFSNPDRERLTVRLVNEKGETLFDQYTNAKEHAYRFRMDGMPAGNYKVVVIGQSKKITRDIAYNFRPGTFQVTMNQAATEDPIVLHQKKPKLPQNN